MTTPRSNERRIGRTAVITAAAIAGVVLASSAAVAANMGILSAADDSEIGSLSATGDVVPADTQVIEIYPDDPAATTRVAPTARAEQAQEFAVDAAGTVSVLQIADGIRLRDVVTNPGWTWSEAQTDASALKVTFTDGVRTLEFDATTGPDGTVFAAVSEPFVAAAPSGSHDDDDEHSDGSEHEDEEHEGREDDD